VGGSSESVAPRFSSAVRDDISDAVYTNTGVMGLVRATTRSRFSFHWRADGSAHPGGAGEGGGATGGGAASGGAAGGGGSFLLDSVDHSESRSIGGVGGPQLARRDSMPAPEPSLALDALAMYVPELVLRQFAFGRSRTLPRAEPVRGALLFADISGFTQLTQRLQASELGPARGAEELNKILSDYFDVLIRCFHSHGGDVVSFSGDAMTVLFEALPTEGAVAATPADLGSPADAPDEANGRAAEPPVETGDEAQFHARRGSMGPPKGLLAQPLHPAVIVEEEARGSSQSRSSHAFSVTSPAGAGRQASWARRCSDESQGSGPFTRQSSDVALARLAEWSATSSEQERQRLAKAPYLGPQKGEGGAASLAGLATFFGFGSKRSGRTAAPRATSDESRSSPLDDSLSVAALSLEARGVSISEEEPPSLDDILLEDSDEPPRVAAPPPLAGFPPPSGKAGPSWTPLALASADPGQAALRRAALRAAQCATEVLELASRFSVERYSQYGVAQISLHAAMGAGDLVGIHVAGEEKPNEASSGVDTAHSARGERPPRPPATVERRDGFALMGTPMRQLREAEKRAGAGECVVAPEAWALLAGHADAILDADGFAKLKSLRRSAHSRTWRLTEAEKSSSKREATLFYLERSAEAAARLAAYVPEPVQYRLRTAGMNWLADFRLASILFVRILSLSHEQTSSFAGPSSSAGVERMVARTQAVFGAIREQIMRYQGMLARFNVDDKGVILFAAFGPPPCQHEDDAVRAVLCALEVVRVLSAQGHEVRVGVTTGTVFAGSVGNAERGEYTFYGDVVNMAARLMTHGANGSILVDEHTMRDAAHEVRFEPTAPLTVKGCAEPVAAFKPTERRGLLGGGPRGRGAAAQTRQDERARLGRTLRSLANEARGGLLMVQGEAGMGKTSLLREAERMAVGLNVSVLKGSCSAIDEGTPLQAFGFVMRQLLDGLSLGLSLGGRARQGLSQSLAPVNTSRGRRHGDDARREGRHLADSPPPAGGNLSSRASASQHNREHSMLATLGTASEARAVSVRSLLDNGSAELWRHVPLLSGLLGLGIADTPYTANLRGEKRRDKLLALCVQLLRAKAQQHPTLILLDNVQWMDAKSWELLLKIKHELPELLVVAAMRTPAASAGADATTPVAAGVSTSRSGRGSGRGHRRTPSAETPSSVSSKSPSVPASPARAEESSGGSPAMRASLCEASGLYEVRGGSGGASLEGSGRPASPPGKANRQMLLSTAEHKLKTSQMDVLTTLEESERIRLWPLQAADLAFMAVEMLGVESLPAELGAFLLRTSEGNPLYCHEIMSFLLRKKLLLPAALVDGVATPLPQDGPEGGDLSCRVESNKPGEPRLQTVLFSPGASLSSLESAFGAGDSVAGNSHTLQRLLTAQVDSLPHEQQAVLKTAAVMGDALTSKQLRDVHRSLAIQPTGSRLDESLRRLRHTGLLEFGLESKTYSFRSAMLRDVVYSNLTYEQRQRVHEAAAQAELSATHEGRATNHLSALKHYKAAENWIQVMLLAADAAEQALGCASWEEAVSVTTLAAVVHRQNGGAAVAPGAPTRWLVLRGEALLALGQRAEANLVLSLAFDDGIRRGTDLGRAHASSLAGWPRRLSSMLGLFKRQSERRGSTDSASDASVHSGHPGSNASPSSAPPRPPPLHVSASAGAPHTDSLGENSGGRRGRYTEGSILAPRGGVAASRGAEASSMGDVRGAERVSLCGGHTPRCEAEVKHALRALAMLFFAQLETAAECSAAATVVSSAPLASRLPIALCAAVNLPDCSERLLGFACVLIAAGLCARRAGGAALAATAQRRSCSWAKSHKSLPALHEAIESFVEANATKLGEALTPPRPAPPAGLLSRSMEVASMETSAPSFLAMLCLALGLSPLAPEATAALWLRRASALALEAEHVQLHRTVCMLSVDAPLAGTL